MTRQHIPPPRRQRGITLIFALIFLILLTMLGGSVAMNNSLQERMAGNTRQRDLAFQATEHALKASDAALGNAASAERVYIDNVIASDPAAATATKPAYLLLNGEGHPNDADYWKNTFDWTTTTSTQVTGVPTSLAASNPRYVIEQMPKASCPDDATKTCFYYRVTSRGVGKDSNAIVILQSMYKIKK